MNAKEANKNLCLFIQQHLISVQSGTFGKPTIEDLEFAGKLHSFLEENFKK